MAISGLVAATLGGCSIVPPPKEDPTRYFVLTYPEAAKTLTKSDAGLVIGIASIEVPSYLRTTKSMIVRRTEYELRYDEYARWAEPIDIGLRGLLREGLNRSDNIRSVLLPPFTVGVNRDYDLHVRVIRCEGALSATGEPIALFAVEYALYPAPGTERSRIVGKFEHSHGSWPRGDFGKLTELLSSAASELAAEIASKVK